MRFSTLEIDLKRCLVTHNSTNSFFRSSSDIKFKLSLDKYLLISLHVYHVPYVFVPSNLQHQSHVHNNFLVLVF